MIEPYLDYLLCEEHRPDSGVVTESNIEDHWQVYKVLAVGLGRYSDRQDKQIGTGIKPGDIIYVQKHAEADTPKSLKDKHQALIMASRVMAVEKESE